MKDVPLLVAFLSSVLSGDLTKLSNDEITKLVIIGFFLVFRDAKTEYHLIFARFIACVVCEASFRTFRACG